MAVKKSDLYSSIWASCDALRGGMDASQYKDYVLFMLFIKYISDKYADSDDFAPPVIIPKGASFKDMLDLRGQSDIGDKINKQIIQPLVESNTRLGRNDFPDFNDPNKLGEGKAMVDRLTDLINIFNRDELDFSKNRAANDDLLGDAYEYLMNNFAKDSGKSKGQFYTPSEVSRILAQVIGISPENSVGSTTVYDPTCGSGSLLIKVADQAEKKITIEGQEKDVSTAGLARMNMIIHDFPTANIMAGNTLSDPKFKEEEQLRQYDYVVANPPFSDKKWSTGISPDNDLYGRFNWGVPPSKQGDYAYLMHIIRSMKTKGKGACILPHGVLFRGNAEAEIRKNLINSGILKGVIGLPANLFFGTGIAACVLVLDKETAENREHIFMINAANGFMKDGNKNRLREQDLHKIVTTFLNEEENERYSRKVPITEIAGEKNAYNLNIPRYIDTAEEQDIQDIEAHLQGGIPKRDVEELNRFWKEMPNLKGLLFTANGRENYYKAQAAPDQLKTTITKHSEFKKLIDTNTELLEAWEREILPKLENLEQDIVPKKVIHSLAENLISRFKEVRLVSYYDVYQHLMDYWAETMQDDLYYISAEGWKAETYTVFKEITSGKKKGQKKAVGWACDLLPKEYIVHRFFREEQTEIDYKQNQLNEKEEEIKNLEEEHGGEDGLLSEVSTKKEQEATLESILTDIWSEEDKAACDVYLNRKTELEDLESEWKDLAEKPALEEAKNSKGNITLKAVKDRIDQLPKDEEQKILQRYLDLDTEIKSKAKKAQKQLAKIEEKYKTLLQNDLALSSSALPTDHVAQTPPFGSAQGSSSTDAESLEASIAAEEEPIYKTSTNLDLSALKIFMDYLSGKEQISVLKKEIKALEKELDQLAFKQYKKLTEEQVKDICIHDKWLYQIHQKIQSETQNVSQRLTNRVQEILERYETPLPKLVNDVADWEGKVNNHLEKMGYEV